MASNTRPLDRCPAGALPPSRDSEAIQQGLGTSSNSATPTLRLLQQELGADVHLLDRIPIHKVKMVKDVKLEYYLPQRILVASVEVEHGWCDAWAFLSTDIERELDGVPHITILSGPQWTNKHSIAQFSSGKAGKWVEVFKNFTDVRRSALIKTCFVLKGAPLPSNTQFKDRVVEDIKAVCRSFGPENHPRPTPSPMPRHEQPMVARKTQQRSPEGQLFSLVSTATSRLHQKHSMSPASAVAQHTADRAQKYPEDDYDTGGNNTNYEIDHTVTNLIVNSETMSIQNNPAGFFYERISCQCLPVHVNNLGRLEQHLNPYRCVSVRCDQTGYFITFEESKEGEGEAVRCYQECHLAFLFGTYEMNMEYSQPDKGTAAGGAPAAMHPDRLALLVDYTSKPSPPKTEALSTHLLGTGTPPPEDEVATQLAADGIVLYKALVDKRDSLQSETKRIESAAAETKQTLNDRREQMKHSIDVEMRARHKKEVQAAMEKLREKHEAEKATRNGAYQELKAKAIDHDRKVVEQLEKVKEEQKAVMQKLEHRRNSLSREELLAFLEKHTDNERAQKRRKVDSDGAYEK